MIIRSILPTIIYTLHPYRACAENIIYFLLGGDSAAPWSVQLKFTNSIREISSVSRRSPAPSGGTVTATGRFPHFAT